VHNQNTTATADVEMPTEPIDQIETPAWHAEVGRFLSHAADLCVQHGVDLDSFMRGAWSAYVEARPGMRDYLEEMQLRGQLEEMRKHGHMGQA
jgi:hypothetical protein